MITTIFTYVISVLYFAIIGYIFLPLSYLLRPMIKYFTYFLPIFIFITDFISKCLAALLVIVTSKWLDVQPTFLMVFIPFLLIISNDWKRISFAKKGISKVKRMLDNSGELKEYNQKMDVITEYAHLFGDLSGILFGSIFILGKVPLI